VNLKTVFRAVYDYYTGSNGASLRAYTVGRIYFEQAVSDADDVIYPYIVVFFVTGGLSRDFDHKYDEPTIQFNAYSDTGDFEQISDIVKEICDCFDDATLSFASSNYTQVTLDRVGVPLLELVDTKYSAIVEYSMMLLKTTSTTAA